jgi:ribonucleoside-diphosphate reductase alpha chain
MIDKERKAVDFEKLKRTVEIGVRMQDNVIDATPYFLEENREQALGERRIGLGVMGLHDLLIYCEKVYGSPEGNELVDKVFETITTTAYEASIELAKEKGAFPFMAEHPNGPSAVAESFVQTGYMRRMPQYIRDGILEHGIRNSHLLTVAPTGSTGTLIGCSTGLEPYFAFKYYRSGRLGKFIPVIADIALEWLNENGYEVTETNIDEMLDKLPEWFVTAMELTPEQHADVQCIIQRWVDSSLSKTVNAPRGYSVEQVQRVYERLYKGGAKGGTVYIDGSRDAQVLSLKAEENTFDEAESPKATVIVETINDVKSTKVTYGSEIGDTCPICRKGEVIDAGGCNTCNNCGSQLKCGL